MPTDASTKPDNAENVPKTARTAPYGGRQPIVRDICLPRAGVAFSPSREAFEAAVDRAAGAARRQSALISARIDERETVAAMAIKLADIEEQARGMIATGHVLEDNLAQVTAERDKAEAERDALKAIFEERFDITRPIDVRQDALLAMNVLDAFADDQGPLTPGDAGRMVKVVRRLLAEFDKKDRQARHDREHCGKLDARIRVLDGRLADMTTNRDALDEACTRKDARIADLTAQRDAAEAQLAKAEDAMLGNATQRDEAEERERLARDAAAGLYGALSYQTELVDRLTDAIDRAEQDIGGESALSVVQLLGPQLAEAHAALKLAQGHGIKPRCRVVTSPRFYGEAERDKAARLFHDETLGASEHDFDATGAFPATTRDWCFEVVDTIAQALGMRRAGS